MQTDCFALLKWIHEVSYYLKLPEYFLINEENWSMRKREYQKSLINTKFLFNVSLKTLHSFSLFIYALLKRIFYITGTIYKTF